MAKRVIVAMAGGFEEIELVSVADILRRGGVEAIMASIGENVCLKGAHNINMCGDIRLSDVPHIESIDGIVLPGGLHGAQNLSKDKLVLSILQDFNRQNKLIASICASSMVLESAGILEGRKFVCYPGFEQGYKTENKGVYKDKNLITANGPINAINFALEILEYLKGSEVVNALKKDLLMI